MKRKWVRIDSWPYRESTVGREHSPRGNWFNALYIGESRLYSEAQRFKKGL